MNIGSWPIQAPQPSTQPPVILAPMAGVTDKPFRQLCRKMGAALAVSEMVTSKAEFQHTLKTRSRLNHQGEHAPVSVQILGTDPQQMAEAARFNVEHGADIIDINMGCPAKKVCNIAAGSALLKNEPLVRDILSTVVQAVSVPVTLKIRTGWDPHSKNALNIAHIAEQSGIQALTIHGRTRACGYKGQAEYDTIKEVKQAVSLPIIANGDIDSAEKAEFVLNYTRADAVMIGRTALSTPWIFADINHYLNTGQHLSEPDFAERGQILLNLLTELYEFYGESHGLRIARKHIAAIIKPLPEGNTFWRKINQINQVQEQYIMVRNFFSDSTSTGLRKHQA